jgi:anti-sigma B factor antagonist
MLLDAKIEPLPDRAAVITLAGSMTMGTSLKIVDGQVQQALSSGVIHLVLDLAGVDYCDSAGLGLIVHTYGHMKERGGSLRLCGVQSRLRSMLHMTNTDTFLTIDADRSASLAELAG